MDAYDLQARHAPVLLTVLPLVILAVRLVPDFQSSLALPTAFAAAVVVAVYGLLARFARARGRTREVRLFADWGGKPTTAMLRHRDTRINRHTKERYHAGLRALGAAFSVPTAGDEQRDPASADERYESAMDEIRRRAKIARDKAVHRENISYGFYRNLLGLKPLGMGLAMACLVVLVAFDWSVVGDDWAAISPVSVGGLVLLVLDLGVWAFLVTAGQVKHQAEAYATALFETIEAAKVV